ncbi:DUF2909 domain-containing protein [Inhella gelatinilytica]|uniref:DUF2909 domain-containing protein n=1 Tax=Inhella gelatinilytica TaxID=2795030 RepID=A0A931IWL3_9BURK|nr:DUF2909 domain-containing protein [Inhella gelatinilytica]MBH9553242.1 DUF2909 domain-containing protein [Inhella gelatinilytica]
MNWIFLVAFVGILGALAAAGVFMLRRPPQGHPPTKAMARALLARVLISIALFALILLAWKLGWIQPRANPLGR